MTNAKELLDKSDILSNEGTLQLGLSQFNVHTMEVYLNEIQSWRRALSDQSEILLYGFQIAVKSIFQTFIQRLAKITGADIGAFVNFADVTLENITFANDIMVIDHPGSESLIVAWQDAA